MKFAFADPPYLGMGRLYDAHHERSRDYDDIASHRALIERLCDEYQDGWALCLHVPSLKVMLDLCPDDVRIAAWVKPFCSFKKGVKRAWSWEPIIFRGGRAIEAAAATWRDHISEPITLRKGLPGAKPWKVCEWVLDGLNFQRGDTVDDLFPGTGVMGEVVKSRDGSPLQIGLFNEAAK